MLKALELTGFKSFADKTRFEFPAGITVVVGPNGSGKSNIVDAIKWVLGEQSAKSLRGKEMSDVIFKGSSGANARRPANSATATIVLDNTERSFSFDADEVHVSRRVYRSGESEYLINGEVCRLKDIRELFRGTGVGTDAYSLIEQGKVERMLQSNPKDRRAIFEEAAGISRFKAKKIEAQRRLARVDANLIRLADIVEEVGKNYRSVKAQASKAARYKDYADRLKLLRTFLAQQDVREFTDKSQTIRRELQESEQQKARLEQQVQDAVTAANEIEAQLDQVTALQQTCQDQVQQIRDQFAQNESQLNLHQSRVADIESRKLELQQQNQQVSRKLKELLQRIATIDQQAEDAEIEYRDGVDQLSRIEAELSELESQLQAWDQSREQHRLQHAQCLDRSHQLNRQFTGIEMQIANLRENQDRLLALETELEQAVSGYRTELASVADESERWQREAEDVDTALAEARQRQRTLQEELSLQQKQLNQLNSQWIAATQRAEVIEELERSLAGINAGAREILEKAGPAADGPLSEVRGLVADLISVNVQHASIVDVALGELAQYVIVDGNQLLELIANEKLKLNGRVGMMQLQNPPTMGADPNLSLNGIEGVIGRTDRLVLVSPEFQDFVRQLLGGTWVVQSLQAALRIREQLGTAQAVRLVTLDGEIIEADGTVLVGPKALALGLISRRSELRALRREIEKLKQEIQAQSEQVNLLTEDLEQATDRVQAIIQQNQQLSGKLAECQSREKVAEQNLRKSISQLQTTQAEQQVAREKLAALVQQQTELRQQLQEVDDQLGELNKTLQQTETQVKSESIRRSDLERQASGLRIKVAKLEQSLNSLQSGAVQYRQELEEHQQFAASLDGRRQADADSLVTLQQAIALALKLLSDLKLQREEQSDELTRLNQSRTEIEHQRRESQRTLTASRDQLRSLEDRVRQGELRLEQLEMQQSQLAERLQDDYNIDLAELKAAVSLEEDKPRSELEQEIVDLRKKLSEIGSVNLDALQELEELENRYLNMDAQYQDLVQAKATLEKIIGRIDADSRKLFVETLNAIRVNFQKLFRQTFGGGQADILLEEGVDPLEAGVEIVATPPGKSQFSNSLLSGGEKALTAVSLLMAIFQFRPSPFCVLDEVDAPFDEANIGRFIDVLKSFLGWTRFVIVTHSKKTMTAATTLYGITMQESGVSKRVSVRFEDVSEDGQISPEAVSRGDGDAA
jgi:chromosome segregation protein